MVWGSARLTVPTLVCILIFAILTGILAFNVPGAPP
jgi:hypothetical protein